MTTTADEAAAAALAEARKVWWRTWEALQRAETLFAEAEQGRVHAQRVYAEAKEAMRAARKEVE